jgi:dTDP-4-dehydrorhamnose reductase
MENTDLKTVLVLGAGGFLGSRLKLTMPKAIYKGKPDYGEIKKLSDVIRVRQLLDEIRPKVILNLVAITDVDYCESNRDEAKIVHSELNKALADWADENSCRVVLISTDMVYDNHQMNNENYSSPLNEYSRTKFIGEKFLDLSRHMVIRTNFTGKSCARAQSFSDWLFRAWSDQKKIVLFDDIFCSFLPVGFLCQRLSIHLQASHVGLYNLGASEIFSKANFAVSFFKILSQHYQRGQYKNFTVAKSQFKTVRPLEMGMDVSKYENDFCTALPTFKNVVEEVSNEYC